MSPKIKGGTKKVEVFLSEQAIEQLREEADKIGSTLSGVIRMIVLEHLKK